MIHTKNRTYIAINQNIKDLKSELSNKGFYEIYRGTLVNLSHRKYIKEDTLILTTGHKLPISRRKLLAFKSVFFDGLQKGVI